MDGRNNKINKMKYLFPKGNKINVGRRQSEEERMKRSRTAKEKGFGKWMLGKKHSKETKTKMAEKRIGKPVSSETREKIRKSNTGKVPSIESRLKNREWHLGKKHSSGTKQKLREISLVKCKRGAEHPSWNGGISKVRYPSEFNNELRLKIRERDNFTCCKCGRTEREELEELNRVLCVNHIDFNKNNCKESNLNTLCLRCNVGINRERDYWTDYFNNN